MTYKVTDLFFPIFQKGNKYPFNTSFRLTKRTKSEFNGPGIYLIGFKGRLIYAGKYEPKNRGDVRSDRIRRHLEGITLRGTQCGFNKECSSLILEEKKLNKILSSSRKYSKRVKGFQPTGAMTSANKIRFALKHIDEFMKKDTVDVFRNFTIGYVRLKPSRNIDELENNLIHEFNPCCNKEYIENMKSAPFDKAYKKFNRLAN